MKKDTAVVARWVRRDVGELKLNSDGTLLVRYTWPFRWRVKRRHMTLDAAENYAAAQGYSRVWE